jgi:hypothetical protein
LSRSTVRFALWFVVALFAAAMALVPVAASAHPGHHDAQTALHGNQQKIDMTSSAAAARGNISETAPAFSQAVRCFSVDALWRMKDTITRPNVLAH